MPMMFSDEQDEWDDGSMFGTKRGTWGISCKSDPRWDGSGSTRSTRVGCFTMPDEAQRHLDRKRQELGCEPPADCEWGYIRLTQ
jgi:hypothetical protein